MTASDKNKAKRLPQRTCVACREVLDKKSLVRFVRTPEEVLADPSGRIPGRGAYVHDTPECWEKAILRGALSRALKTEISEENRVQLRNQMYERFGAADSEKNE